MTRQLSFPIRPPAPDWLEVAPCRGVAIRIFYPEPSSGAHPYKRARELCRSCPYREDCLDWAMANRESQGFWGGMSEGERRALRVSRANQLRWQIADCGTESGYQRHRNRHEKACPACLAANALVKAERRTG